MEDKKDLKDMKEEGATLQRDKETYAISPHIPGGIILNPNVLRKIADVAEKYHAKALKLTSGQRIAIIGLQQQDLDNAWHDLDMPRGRGGMCMRGVRICPATHFCKRAQQDAVTLGLELDKRYHGLRLPAKFKLAVSGCMNSCTEPALRDLGIMGTPKGYTIYIGGTAGIKPKIADVLLQNVQPEDVPPIVEKIVNYYKENARNYERIGAMIKRIGFDKVKQDIVG